MGKYKVCWDCSEEFYLAMRDLCMKNHITQGKMFQRAFQQGIDHKFQEPEIQLVKKAWSKPKKLGVNNHAN